MRVGYSRVTAVVFLCLGLVLIGLNGWLYSKTHAGLWRVAPGAILMLVGALYTFRTYFEVVGDAVVARAALGPAKKTYPFSKAGDVKLEGGAVWVAGKKTGLRRWMSNPKDWEALQRFLERSVADTFE